MKKMSILRNIMTLLVLLVMTPSFAQAVKVEVKQVDGNWQLFRGGEPYYIKGAGGLGYMEEVVERGGNSIRTWSVDDAQEVLDKAHELGLTVMMGLWVQHERHGYDYDNEAANKAQLEYFTKMVKKYTQPKNLKLYFIESC